MNKLKRAGEWFEIKINESFANNTVFHILSSKLGVSKATIQKWNKEGSLRRNNTKADVNHQLRDRDILSIHLFKEEEFGVIPEKHDFSILYEDDHLIIIDKPAGMDTHPNHSDQVGTLANAVAYYYQTMGIQTRVRHIHRLDKETSGAIIFAKNDLAHTLLDQALQLKKIKRTYLAFVGGNLQPQKGTINKPIGRDRHHPTRRRVSPQGQQAITHYQVEHYDEKKDLSVVTLQLDTGRTHQIRVHMSYLGHSILGDGLYGGSIKLITRQALHSKMVSFTHPITLETINCEAELPKDMSAILR
ncbi:RluA family pseudouridine synthase [Bacillus weihaiensis]|uniref:Pseudouridine synthase n=1 Tax=Bacillus weihaiensis TaxID=1547283 RepID=A0A1L3MUY9_9BACI|nr:RluA family pseudouridine synthase [Bacillus weihaiensis]APH06157.1 RNA pseudouridine synthase [Bacillus weihaiensis]